MFKKGHIVSEETRRKISKSHVGITSSIESREKNRLAHTGRTHVMSEETRKKISIGNKGKVRSPEVYKAMCERLEKARENGAPNTGHHPSLDARKRMSLNGIGKHYNQTFSDEDRKRRSILQVNRMLAGDSIPPGWCKVKKGIFYSVKSEKNIRYDSNLEYECLDYLESLSIVKSFDRCFFSINYIQKDLSVHNYIPDFEVKINDDTTMILEVKGKGKLLKSFKDGGKLSALIVFCTTHKYDWIIYLGWRKKNEDRLVTIGKTGREVHRSMVKVVSSSA